MRFLLVLFMSLFMISCKKSDGNNDQNVEGQNIEKLNTKILVSKADVSKMDFIDFMLDDKAQKDLENWKKYYELDQVFVNAKQADLVFFKDNNEVLVALIKDLKTTIPESINTPLIMARLTVIETKMFKLEAGLNISNPDKEEVLSLLKEFLVSYSNLNLQINKKFEKESQNIQKPN